VLGGIQRYARRHTDWGLFLMHGMSGGPAPSSAPDRPGPAARRRPRDFDAMITGVTRDSRESIEDLNLPVVVVGDGATGVRHPWVGVDHAAAAVAAVDHLRDHGWSNLLAFTHGDPQQTQVARFQAGFREAAGPGARIFTTGPRTRARGRWTYEDQIEDLTDVMREVGLPCGVVTSDEEHAWRTIRTASAAGWRVPDEVGVVSLGMDSQIAELTEPALTTVPIDHDAVGYAAARVLDGMLRGEPPELRIHVPPGRVVERASSGLAAVDDPDVTAALRFIDERLEDPIRIEDVAEAVLVSPRTLHRKFAAALGRTPGSVIRRARVRFAERLLAQTDRELADIASTCGMGLPSQFGRDFKRATGVTPAQYRAKHHV
jgi:LacI family transcriptional regulator